MTDKVTRWTGSVNASEQGGFVAYGDYLATLYELKAKDAEIAALAAKLERLKVQEPVQFLCDATRFKTTLLANGDVRITNMPYELAGRWVALVAAENDCHLKLAAHKAPQDDIGSITSANMRLQGEVERLNRLYSKEHKMRGDERDEMNHLYNTVIEQRDDLRSQVDSLNVGFNNCQKERDALAAELAGLKAQEPVPPEQVEAAWRAGWAACRDAADVVENADTPDCGGWTAIGIADAVRNLKEPTS